MRRKFFFIPAIIVLTFAFAFAQQPSAGSTSVDRLKQTVSYLASDALEGRRTGTPGANDAARYIAGEFNRLGLRAAVQPARPTRAQVESLTRYFQPFPYVAHVELGKNNALTITTHGVLDAPQMTSHQTLRIGTDWMPLGFSSNAKIESDALIFAGYGISASELKYDDYAVSPRDRVAIIFDGTPDGDNPHGQFARPGELRFKAAAARAAGARALVVISGDNNLNDDRLSHLSYDNAGEAGLPVVVISRSVAATLLGGAEGLSAYEKSAKARTNNLPIPKGVSLTVDVIRRESPSFNVVGILPGSDPILSKLNEETIVIGAHYDHLGRGGEGSLAPREGDIHHGADDNASGVAGLIELARMLSTQNPKPRRTIVFIAFSGEEEGLLGSDYYVNHPIFPLAKTVTMINMDMIGRLQDSKLIVGGVGTASDWRSMIQSENTVEKMQAAAAKNPSASGSPNYQVSLNGQASSTGFPIVIGANGQPVVTAELSKLPLSLSAPFALTLNEDGFGPSDHSSFYSKQVPVLFFWTGTHDDYHKPSDTADKINYEGEARIVSFVERIVSDIDKSDKRPTYTVAKSEPQGRSNGFRVYLGTIPNYADSNDGLKLDGVRDDSPAAKAGLKAGDRVVKLAGRDVKNVYDYTYALGEMKAGQEYEVEVMRDGQRLTMKIKPEARK
ncbi:MAG TPA: M20/M25/M40 family metallo-hydrolase [Pyrinomonadaceae bacterium]